MYLGEVDVNIRVLDFNDCPPVFVDPPPSRNIREDSVMGSVVFTFTVNDCDGGLNGVNGSRFSIIAGLLLTNSLHLQNKHNFFFCVCVLFTTGRHR